jgi:hypothetical protein
MVRGSLITMVEKCCTVAFVVEAMGRFAKLVVEDFMI